MTELKKSKLVNILNVVKSVYFTYNNKKSIDELKYIYDVIKPLYNNIISDDVKIPIKNFNRKKETTELNNLTSVKKVDYISNKFKSKMKLSEGLKRMKFYYKILRNDYKNNLTLKRKLTTIRQTIKKYQSKQLYKYSTYDTYFNISKKERDKIITDNETKITNKNNKNLIIKQSDILDFYNKIKNSTHKKDLIFKLLINSGFRLNGLYTTDIKEHKTDPYKIIISNIPKMRNKNKILNRELLFMDSKQFITDLNKLKSYDKSYLDKNNNVVSRISNMINRYIKSRFKQYKFMNSSFLRKLYLILLYDRYKNQYDNINMFIKSNLGHKELSTSFNYSIVKLI